MSKSRPGPTFLLLLILLVFGLACGLTGGEATPELPPPPIVTDAALGEEAVDGQTAVSPTEGAVGETDTDAVPTPT
jgi:hypothetical protein